MATKTVRYRAVFARERDGRWNVEIPAVKGCYTHGRTIAQARERIREALGLFIRNAESVTIVDEIRLPAAVRRHVARLEDMRARAELTQRQLKEAQRAAAIQLRSSGLSFRDSGEILGCTRQRVEQLAKSASAEIGA